MEGEDIMMMNLEKASVEDDDESEETAVARPYVKPLCDCFNVLVKEDKERGDGMCRQCYHATSGATECPACGWTTATNTNHHTFCPTCEYTAENCELRMDRFVIQREESKRFEESMKNGTNAEFNRLMDIIDKLQEEVASLTKKNEWLQGLTDGTNEDFNFMYTDWVKLTKENEKLQGEVASLTKEIEHLRGQFALGEEFMKAEIQKREERETNLVNLLENHRSKKRKSDLNLCHDCGWRDRIYSENMGKLTMDRDLLEVQKANFEKEKKKFNDATYCNVHDSVVLSWISEKSTLGYRIDEIDAEIKEYRAKETHQLDILTFLENRRQDYQYLVDWIDNALRIRKNGVESSPVYPVIRDNLSLSFK